jgi:hypothetical protein
MLAILLCGMDYSLPWRPRPPDPSPGQPGADEGDEDKSGSALACQKSRPS